MKKSVFQNLTVEETLLGDCSHIQFNLTYLSTTIIDVQGHTHTHTHTHTPNLTLFFYVFLFEGSKTNYHQR